MKKLFKDLALALVVAICCMTTAFGASNGAMQKPMFNNVSKDFAAKVFDEYAKCDYNLAICEKAFSEWVTFAENYGDGVPQAEVEHCVKILESYKAELVPPIKITLSDSEVSVFRSEGLKVNDFQSHNIVFENFYKDLNLHMDNLIYNAQQPSVAILVEGFTLANKSNYISVEYMYYDMLHTFSQLSPVIFDKSLNERFEALNYQFEVKRNLPTSEYERMGTATLEKLERVLNEYAEYTNQLGQNVMSANEYHERFDMACEALDEAFAAVDTFENITFTAEDTKESALEKIYQFVAAIENLKIAAYEYLDVITAMSEALYDGDTSLVDGERESFEMMLLDIYGILDEIKQQYESLGFGKFE